MYSGLRMVLLCLAPEAKLIIKLELDTTKRIRVWVDGKELDDISFVHLTSAPPGKTSLVELVQNRLGVQQRTRVRVHRGEVEVEVE